MSSDSDQECMDIYEDHDYQVENDRVDDEDDKMDGEDDKIMMEDENEEEPGEKEDVADEEADERYWKAKAKEGVHKVCLSEISENN
jgi:hypothetical protein